MLSYVARRTFHSVIALIGLLMLVFFLSRLTGDPAAVLLPVDATVEQRQEFAVRHGFDRPLIVQFGSYVLDVLRFDFGASLRQQRDAMQPALEAFPHTLQLAFVTMLLAIPVAVCCGVVAASRPGGLFDRLTTILTLAGASAPTFWIAILGVLFFSVSLHWLPTSGTGTPAHWVLPVGVLMLRPVGLLAQVVRTDGRGPQFALRKDRLGQGRAEVAHSVRPCAAQLAAAARQRGRRRDGQLGERHRGGRDHLRLAGHRRAHAELHHRARFRRGAGLRPADRLRDLRAQHRHRPTLCALLDPRIRYS